MVVQLHDQIRLNINQLFQYWDNSFLKKSCAVIAASWWDLLKQAKKFRFDEVAFISDGKQDKELNFGLIDAVTVSAFQQVQSVERFQRASQCIG